MPLSGTKKKLIVALVLFLVLGATFFGTYLLVEEKHVELADARYRLATADDRSVKLKSLNRLLEETEDERMQLSALFVEEEAIVEYINSLESISLQSGTTLEITLVQIVEGDTEGLDYLEVEMSAFGSWSQVYHFLSLLETIAYETLINRAYVEKHSEGEDGVWKGSFRVHVPLLPGASDHEDSN